MANKRRGALLHSPAAVTRPIKRGREFAVDELFDEVSRTLPQRSFDRIKPIVEKQSFD
jgi:hypothetical protein